MQMHVHADRPALGRSAATEAAAALRAAVAAKGAATCVVATGASQFDTLAALTADASVPWEKITAFHLDEYVGLSDTHPASFRKYLRERFMAPLARKPAAFHEIDGSGDAHAECGRLAALVPAGNFDVSLVGIGENAHLAFNDPPADFAATTPYLVVDLDEACRMQQVGEGWFAGLADVPRQAISMSIRRIMASDLIVCSVPDVRKAEAVRGVVEGAVTPRVPASILREHSRCSLHLDKPAASLLTANGRS
ncbi:MAG: 6-phosphogluconolactonase [Planctomycetia bacterium]